SAWVTGMRSVQKALLYALLEPYAEMKKMQDENDLTSLMVWQEELKTAPFGDVWEEYLKRENIPADYLSIIKEYEKNLVR
ncbi:MAG: L-rhamnose isomerase, partial [Clostridia bacterium]|nr:L-rhamnose isomerase [Clostridia bacterium]